jgi:GDPmannose 4,6-dehydratase
MFGNAKPPYNEKTRYNTTSPYGESKLKAHQDFVEEYRRRYNLFICSGIMFNHESPVRHKNCVTRKITHSLAKIKLGKQEYFELGNIDTKRDWGYAGDYVEAMWKMLQQKKPDDYVIATGKSHSVRDFLNAAAKAIDIDIIWSGKGLKEIGKNKKTGKTIVKINKKFFRPTEINHSRGDGSKARRKLGWEPKTSFNELAEMMAKSDLKLVRRETS